MYFPNEYNFALNDLRFKIDFLVIYYIINLALINLFKQGSTKHIII